MSSLLIVGCGYVGSELASLLAQDAAATRLYALTRGSSRFEVLQQMGVTPIQADWCDATSLHECSLPEEDAIVFSVPHREINEFGVESHVVGLKNVLNSLPCQPRRIVYLSTTGVYSDCDGSEVNEDTPVSPVRVGPQIAVHAENWLQDQLGAESLTILRLAGIYGPQRLPMLSKLQSGEPLDVPPDGCVNLIHVHDAARVIGFLTEQSLSRKLYVLSDGQPVRRRDFYLELARICGLPIPQFVESAPHQPGSGRRATDKRICPNRILEESQLRLAFQCYRDGLVQASLAW